MLEHVAASGPGKLVGPTESGVLDARCGRGCVPFMEGRNSLTHWWFNFHFHFPSSTYPPPKSSALRWEQFWKGIDLGIFSAIFSRPRSRPLTSSGCGGCTGPIDVKLSLSIYSFNDYFTQRGVHGGSRGQCVHGSWNIWTSHHVGMLMYQHIKWIMIKTNKKEMPFEIPIEDVPLDSDDWFSQSMTDFHNNCKMKKCHIWGGRPLETFLWTWAAWRLLRPATKPHSLNTCR